MRWSSTRVMTSPCSSPARAAAEPSVTLRTRAPSAVVLAAPPVTSPTLTPILACVGVSPLLIWSTIGMTSSIGIAKPSPIEPDSLLAELDAVRIEELIPITSPFMSTNGPPLLPGLIAASVWIAGYVVALPCASVPTLTGRFKALTMPLVTVDSRPYGDPIATTSWPTSSWSDRPIVAGVSPLTSSAWITAVSVSGSVPSTVAEVCDPSSNDTSRVPESPASSTTWLLVRIVPSALRMMPDPEPDPWAPVTSILTTEGRTAAATSSTDPVDGASPWCTAGATDDELEAVGVVSAGWVEVQRAAPPRPAPAPTTRDAATTEAARPPRRGGGGGGAVGGDCQAGGGGVGAAGGP